MKYDRGALQGLIDQIVMQAVLRATISTHTDLPAFEAELKRSAQAAIDDVLQRAGPGLEHQEEIHILLDQALDPVFRAIHER